ncbi:MAG: diacylglycerol/lipid kinase family protein [Spirochaetia bacterium]
MTDLVSAYANGVSELARFSHAEEQPPLVVDVIVNPHAGFFKSQRVVSRQIRELEKKLSDLRERAPRRKVEINRVHYTEHPGHARLITEDLLDAESTADTGCEHLFIGCGGDGTSNEICTALVHADGAVLDRLKLLRLPLGTGNDVADARTFSEAYDLILGDQRVATTGALRVSAAGAPARYSFNVASIGLDAYIAGLTNRFKRLIPGDAYKSLVDIGSLFYERRVKPLPMDIVIHGDAGETRIDALVPSMVVMGISGGRTYGGHLPVLPRDDNVCIVARMGAWAKIRNKRLFYEGRHGELPEVSFHRAERVDVAYEGSIPMQLDGELAWLSPRDFPLRMELLPPRIKVLRR